MNADDLLTYDLGNHHWPVTTSSADAQAWFDRGLRWCYGFNHEAAIMCFERATASDPDCIMAWWGLAYACGPNYNKPWALFDPTDLAQTLTRAHQALDAAERGAAKASALERALVTALRARYPRTSPDTDLGAWNDAYCTAMRAVKDAFAGHLDVLALYVESVLDRTPWQMWDLAKRAPAPGAGTLEVEALCEDAFRSAPDALRHPGLLHLYVHLMEMSPWPERALHAAEALRDLAPDAGHLVHMPTHIDLLCGNYQNVVRWNQRAIVADGKWLAHAGPGNFYTFYRVHNLHFAAYGAMFLAQYGKAMAAVQALIDTIPEPLLRVESPPMADYLEGYVGMKQHVLIRFGRWEDIVAQPPPADRTLYSMTYAMHCYAKGVAHAALGNVEASAAARDEFLVAAQRVPATRRVHNNLCSDLLGVARAMLEGELAYRRGHFEAAFASLRESVRLADTLPFDEPWGWMQPPRHALGALLLEQGHAAEAEAVYRADLGIDDSLPRARQHPDNVWSLHGLVECLEQRQAHAEAAYVRQRLTVATALADVPITRSCFCRRENNCCA